jgi:hypothetical protein
MQAAVKTYIRQVFKDPDSVKDLSKPMLAQYGVSWSNSLSGRPIRAWIIAFTCNARNSYGGYTGTQAHMICWNSSGIDWNAQAQLPDYAR